MRAGLGQLRFTIATLIKGLAPGTALQMLHDSALDACSEYDKYPQDMLTPAQRDIVLRDRNRWLDEVGTASEAPAEAWNAAHPGEPQVWPTMIMGDGPRGVRCQFYSSGLMEYPSERTRWYTEAGIEETGLGAVDPETLTRAHRTVARGEAIIGALEVVRGPADWLLGRERVDAIAGGIREATGLPNGAVPTRAYDCSDAAFGGLFACATGDPRRRAALWGAGAAVVATWALSIGRAPWWATLMGATVAGGGTWAAMREGGQ